MDGTAGIKSMVPIGYFEEPDFHRHLRFTHSIDELRHWLGFGRHQKLSTGLSRP